MFLRGIFSIGSFTIRSFPATIYDPDLIPDTKPRLRAGKRENRIHQLVALDSLRLVDDELAHRPPHHHIEREQRVPRPMTLDGVSAPSRDKTEGELILVSLQTSDAP